jgi:2-aminoadipate transaminase
VSADEVLVTTGSQQGLDLSAKLFLDEGDTVLCESPTYLAAISAFKVFSPRFVEVPTDDGGMKIEALERLLTAERPKLIYVVPNFQNPSGRTWTLERRVQFMELLRRHPIAVVEDNPYGEVYFEGEPLPALQSFDRSGSVVLLGTFSKVLAPGLRVGWVAARSPLIEKYVILKQATDLHTCIFSQMLVERYLERFDLDADLRRIRELYRQRRDAMLEALEGQMPAGVRFTRPSGGLFVWVELPGNLNARELLRRCLERDVAFVPGGAFFPERSREDTLRLNFSNMPVDRIREGVRRLAGALREMLAEGEGMAGGARKEAARAAARR